jgi:hypothetical protein
MTSLTTIRGLEKADIPKLKQAGVTSREELLDVGGTRTGRARLARETGVPVDLILQWVNRADLSRLDGVDEEYANLLEAAGVDTVPELSHRRADNLHAHLTEVNARQGIVHRLPSAAQVAVWIAEADKLPKLIEY